MRYFFSTDVMLRVVAFAVLCWLVMVSQFVWGPPYSSSRSVQPFKLWYDDRGLPGSRLLWEWRYILPHLCLTSEVGDWLRQNDKSNRFSRLIAAAGLAEDATERSRLSQRRTHRSAFAAAEECSQAPRR